MKTDPTGGYWTGKPFTDREWFPLLEAIGDFDVPGMVHVAASCNPDFHPTGAHYINADTSVFMQILRSDLFKDFRRSASSSRPAAGLSATDALLTSQGR